VDENSNDEMGDLIDQLINADKYIKKPELAEEQFDLKKEDLEEFIIKSAGSLINKSVAMVNEIKDYVRQSPAAEDVISLAELIKASSSALDSLSKVLIQNKKELAQKELKQLDLAGKKELLQGEFNARSLLSRDEVFKELFKKAENNSNSDVIDIQSGPTNQLTQE
jgi:DNA-binding protein